MGSAAALPVIIFASEGYSHNYPTTDHDCPDLFCRVFNKHDGL
jgi:hypothetical protein